MAGAVALAWLSSWCAGHPAEVAPAVDVDIAYVAGAYPKPDYLSLLQTTPDNLGEAGARLALKEINITGRFVGRTYAMSTARVVPGKSLADQLRSVLAATKLLVADLQPADLVALADMPEAKDAVILDMRTRDDDLRQANCRRNTFHILPSTAMLTDALGQYLMQKRWPRWALLKGTTPADDA